MTTRETLLLEQIGTLARQLGLGEDGARVAQAIALTEGALGGAVGDNGQSYGPFQFHARGMLPAYAQSLGLSVSQAAAYAKDNPEHAAGWALQGYLGQAIRDGQGRGLTGPALATYAQTYGQRSQNPERAGQQYKQLQAGEPTKEATMDPEDYNWGSDIETGDPYQGYQAAEAAGAGASADPVVISQMLAAARQQAASLPEALKLRMALAIDNVERALRASDEARNSKDIMASEYQKNASTALNTAMNQLNTVWDDAAKANPLAKPQTEAELAKEAYDKRRYDALSADLDQYGLEGRPRPQTPPMSSPSAMMAAQEAASSGAFTRGPKFEWEKEESGRDYELTKTRDDETRRQNAATNEYNQARLAQEKLLREMADQEAWRRAQLSTAEGLYGTNANTFTKMAAAAPLPGQQYHLGYEPGGTMENIARLSGRAYNPESYRVGIQTFDPEEAWRRAQAMAGR